MKIDTSDWKEFVISKLFDIYTGGDLIMSSLEDGNIPIASNSCENNNIASYTNYLDDRKLFDHNRSISIADRGCFQAFIQPKDFYIATRVKALVCKDFYDITINQLAFIASIINLESFKYNYGRNCCANLPFIKIKLPAKRENNKYVIDSKKQFNDSGFIPDWDYMEKHMCSLHNKAIKTKIKSAPKEPLNVNNWRYFEIKDLFFVKLSLGDIKIEDVDKGCTPLISSGENDNGLIGYITEEGDGIAQIFDENTITVDMFCNAFYQPKKYFSVSHGRVNILVPKFKMNKYTALFICTIINNEKFKYSYGRGLYSTEAGNLKIKLPFIIDNENNMVPNFALMEQYMKQLPYSDRI